MRSTPPPSEEITELLLDSADDLTAAQIVAIRRRMTDFRGCARLGERRPQGTPGRA